MKFNLVLLPLAICGLLTFVTGCAQKITTIDINGQKQISVGVTTFTLPNDWEALKKDKQLYWRIRAEDIVFFNPTLANNDAKKRQSIFRGDEPYITITHITDPITVAHIKKMAADHEIFKQFLQQKYDTDLPLFKFKLLKMNPPEKGQGVSYTFTHDNPISPSGEKLYVIITHLFAESYGVISVSYIDFEPYDMDGKKIYDLMLSSFQSGR